VSSFDPERSPVSEYRHGCAAGGYRVLKFINIGLFKWLIRGAALVASLRLIFF
jgi:hypothetical protein